MSDIQRLNFQQLLYLEALVKEKHVTRAAELMGVGQPAMSSALAKLRTQLGDPLLIKTSSGMAPTARAMELTRRARELIDLLEGRGIENQDFDPARSKARFTIMASDGISRILLPELMRMAVREAPQMRFFVHPGDVRRAPEYLRDGDFDLVIAFMRKAPSDLRQTTLYPQDLVCIARKNHPAIHGKLSLAQFVAQLHAVWGAPPINHPTMEIMVDEALQALGHSRHVMLKVSSVMLLAGVVARSDLLAVVPRQLALASQQVMDLQILPLPFKLPHVTTSMLWHERLHMDPAHKWLRKNLKLIAKDIPNALASAS